MRQDLVKQGEERRTQVLFFVQDFIDERGFPPTVREIATGVGLAAPGTVRIHLARLAEEGWLRVEPGVHRGIVLL